MGKCMRKAKLSGEVAVMEVATRELSLGVRTRARALAAAAPHSSLSYLELRSSRRRRRLEKPRTPSSFCNPKETTKWRTNRKFNSQKPGRAPRSNTGASPTRCLEKDEEVEVSCENVLEAEWRVREATPSKLINGSETVGTPSSTRRSAYTVAGNRRMQNPVHKNVPSLGEMEEFFVGLEKLQHQIFIDKYNFDPVDEQPLPGRYEWVKLDSERTCGPHAFCSSSYLCLDQRGWGFNDDGFYHPFLSCKN